MLESWQLAVLARASTRTTVVTTFSEFHLPYGSLFSRLLLSLVALDTVGSFFYLMSLVAGTELVESSVMSKFTAKVEVYSYSIFSLLSSGYVSSYETGHLTRHSIADRLVARMGEVVAAIPLDASSFDGHSPFSVVVSYPVGATTDMTTTYTLLGPGVVLHSLNYV